MKISARDQHIINVIYSAGDSSRRITDPLAKKLKMKPGAIRQVISRYRKTDPFLPRVRRERLPREQREVLESVPLNARCIVPKCDKPVQYGGSLRLCASHYRSGVQSGYIDARYRSIGRRRPSP